MKQTIFMIILTAAGALGALVVEPFVGVAVYYFFAVLRPQYLWKWALPIVQWSEIVAIATIIATTWVMLASPLPDTPDKPVRRFSGVHKAFMFFGVWICLTYFTSQFQDVAWPWFLEYLKLFLMFIVAALAIREIRQVWWIYLSATVALIYIGYEMNFVYFAEGRLDIYRSGYGGLDNNGAGLMLAMGIPLAISAWEGSTSIRRWLYLLGVPLLIHAVLMSYSRGAMVSLVAVTPIIILRSRRKRQFVFVFVLLLALVPYLAGKEIREEFFSVESYDTDKSAEARFGSWGAAVRIANAYPVFGVGIRNSPLYSYAYGADYAGRVIHSQYLQTLADNGYPGLLLYLSALASLWVSMSRTRRVVKKRGDQEARLAHSMLNGIEGAMAVFCVGGLFLSLEVFELPFVLALLGAQTSLLARLRTAEEPAEAAMTQPVRLPMAHQRA